MADDRALDEHRLRRLIEAGRSLVSELDLEVVLAQLLETARELTSARFAAIGVLSDDRTELERFLTVGIEDEARARIGDLPRGRGILGVLIDAPRPLRLRHVGEHPRSYGFPVHHPPMDTFLGVPILIRGESWGNLYLTEKRGGAEFDTADEQAAVVLAEWAAIAIDNARLYQGVEERRAELERAVRGLRTTTEIARAMGGETDINRVLELIVKRGRALIDARGVVILLPEAGELKIAATAGDLPADIAGRRLPIAGSGLGDVLRNRRSERLDDPGARLGMHVDELGVSAQAALLVPLVFRGQGRGVLAAFDRTIEGPTFNGEDEELLMAFAASAATAVATAESVERERLRHSIEAAEQERARWARELHDETLQGLVGLQMLLSLSKGRGAGKGLEDGVERALEQITVEIRNLRALISELRPAALDELGLAPALETLCERKAAGNDLQVEVEIDLARERGDEPERLEAETENTIYRLVQEALTNVAKHADAEHVEVRVVEDGTVIDVRIQDDGVGFDLEQPRAGFGLTGMMERVALLGGDLQMESDRELGGTVVRATIPVARRQPSVTRRAAG